TSGAGGKRSKKTPKKAVQPKPKEQATAEATGLPRRSTLRARAPVDYVQATHGFARDDSDDGDYQPDEDPDDGVDDEMQDLGDAESPLTGDSDAGGGDAGDDGGGDAGDGDDTGGGAAPNLQKSTTGTLCCVA
ncbi:hypothetical protein PF008_g31411, partial [Phytophthora fragariae]